MGRKRALRTLSAAGATALCAVTAAGCATGGGGSSGTVDGHQSVTITYSLYEYGVNAPEEKVFESYVQDYENAHPWVHVDLISPVTATGNSQGNIVTRAAAGTVPDVANEQYQDVTAGAVPSGILMNLKPYLDGPDPYVPGNKAWIDLWDPSAVSDMTSPNGDIDIIVGSAIWTGLFYNKADFAKAGITSTPATFAEFVTDLQKLKAAGIAPFLFGDASTCNVSWWERQFMTEFLENDVAKMGLAKGASGTSGAASAHAILKGIISMKNPAYAEGWELLKSLTPYFATGMSSYDACASLTATSPPLSEIPPFAENKAAMFWGYSDEVTQVQGTAINGKYGVFAFPNITAATTPYATGVNVTGIVGGDNGAGEIVIPTQKADHSMNPYKLKWVINLLQYLYAPQRIGQWVAGISDDTNVPVIDGAQVQGAPGTSSLIEGSSPPVVVDGILDGSLTTDAQNSGGRLLQEYLGGSMSQSQFNTQWDALLVQAAKSYLSSSASSSAG